MIQAERKEFRSIVMKKNKGATLFTALVVTSMILAIGASISTVAFKSVRLSSIGRDSQAAYYATEGGLECGMYWHRVQRAFNHDLPTVTLNCNGINNILATRNCVGAVCTYTFNLPFPNVSYCADVKVIKDGGRTTIESRGYNTCDSGRRVERRLRYST